MNGLLDYLRKDHHDILIDFLRRFCLRLVVLFFMFLDLFLGRITNFIWELIYTAFMCRFLVIIVAVERFFCGFYFWN